MEAQAKACIFSGLVSIDDLGKVIGTTGKQLRFLLYGRPESERYTVFTISKRRGGTRTINAPRKELKAVQRRLADLLQDRVECRPSAHGFVRCRSIASNAALHVRHRTVLNVDLKDFFPSINFGRVRGLFMAAPFGASPAVATVLAQLCCHKGVLPQGAPTSPVVSNMVCWKMDAMLQRLAKTCDCIYTRYADDITFSKQKSVVPKQLAVEDGTGNVHVGKDLREIIEGNGFCIHPDKVHLYSNTHRQTVTGLTVNAKVNVSRKFIRGIRAMISDWRRRGCDLAEQAHHNEHYLRPSRLGRKPPFRKIIEGKINFLKMVRGVDDPVRRNLQRQLVAVWPEYEVVMEKENRKLDTRDLFISHATEDKQDFIRPLVGALIREGVSIWYDEFELTIGDSLVDKVNDGLRKSRYGLVVLSPNFFNIKKTWPDREVSALFAQEDVSGQARILPIWHKVDRADVAKAHPLLAARIAWKTSEFGPEEMASKLRGFLKDHRGKVRG